MNSNFELLILNFELAYLIDSIIRWVTTVIETGSYPGLVFVTILENVFPPIPSEAILPFAGFLSATGKFNIWLVIFSGTLGSVIGALILYAFGYYGNEKIVRACVKKYGRFMLLKEEDLDGAEMFFKKHGLPAVFSARLIPIFRSIVSIPAGLAKMPLLEFITLTAIGTSLWCGVLAFLGRFLGENWKLVGAVVKKYEQLVLVLATFLLIYLFYRRVKSLKCKV